MINLHIWDAPLVMLALKRMQVILPPLEEQKEIVQKIKSLSGLKIFEIATSSF
jgi:Type I restriction modification DNA specificity domain